MNLTTLPPPAANAAFPVTLRRAARPAAAVHAAALTPEVLQSLQVFATLAVLRQRGSQGRQGQASGQPFAAPLPAYSGSMGAELQSTCTRTFLGDEPCQQPAMMRNGQPICLGALLLFHALQWFLICWTQHAGIRSSASHAMAQLMMYLCCCHPQRRSLLCRIFVCCAHRV